jgi:hypothetical protein
MDEPVIYVEHNDISALTGTWCQYEVEDKISKEEYQKDYKKATKGNFTIKM